MSAIAQNVPVSEPMARALIQMWAQIALLNLRAEYVQGRITIEEFERRVELLLHRAEPHLRPLDPGDDRSPA